MTVGPIEVKGKAGTTGHVDESVLLAVLVGGAAQRWGWLPGSVLHGTALGGFTNLVGGGMILWVFVGAFAPWCFLQNRYGVQQRPKSVRGRWLGRLRRRPRTGAPG